MNKSKFDKPFVVIDLGSGSYTLDSEGHEKFNEERNPKTGKFYGYCPPLGNVNIRRLGAKGSAEMVEGVTVIYVRKVEGRSDRVISSYIQDATVYGHPLEGWTLGRMVSTVDGMEFASYSIESDNLTKISDVANAPRFVIHCRDYSPCMFRKQRFYRGTYPELDAQIIEYMESIEKSKETL